jgi:hypothetical protein
MSLIPSRVEAYQSQMSMNGHAEDLLTVRIDH